MADSAAARTADFTISGEAPRLTPAKETLVGFPRGAGVVREGGWEKATPRPGQKNATVVSCPVTFRNVLRSIILPYE